MPRELLGAKAKNHESMESSIRGLFMNTRLIMAMEVAEQIGAMVLQQECKAIINNEGAICGFPLMEKPKQDLPFCWFCVTDKMTAQRGKNALTKAKLLSKGIVMDEFHPPTVTTELVNPRNPNRVIDREVYLTGWLKGMPL